jgi:hypothetical protein
MDERTQALLRDPDVPFQDKAHLFERLDDTRAAYAVMVEGLEGEALAAREAAKRSVREGGETLLDFERLSKTVEAAERELEMWRNAGEVRQGSEVILVKGKANMRQKDGGASMPIGSQGWVSWVGQRTNRWGRTGRMAALVRVGDDRLTGFYALVEDLEVNNPWASVKRLIAERETLEVCCPQTGDQIRCKRTGRTGEVFWVSMPDPSRRRRIGYVPDTPLNGDAVATRGRLIGKKIVWGFAAEVELQTSWDAVS